MCSDQLDHLRVARAVLVQALDDAKRGRFKKTKTEAREWLTEQPNTFRDAILGATNLTQSDLDKYVRELADV